MKKTVQKLNQYNDKSWKQILRIESLGKIEFYK